MNDVKNEELARRIDELRAQQMVKPSGEVEARLDAAERELETRRDEERIERHFGDGCPSTLRSETMRSAEVAT